MDSKIQKMEGEKKRMSKVRIPKQQRGPVTNFMAALGLKHFAQDAEPQDIAEAVDALAEEREKTPEDMAKDTEMESPEEQAKEDQGMAALNAKVDQLAEAVKQCMQMMQGAKDEKPEDAIDGLIEELSEGSEGENSTGDEEESMTIPVEEMDEDIPDGVVIAPEDRPENPIPGADSAAMVRALKAMKKVVAQIPDAKTRKVACDSLIAEFKKTKGESNNKNGYSQIMKAQKQNALKQQKANDSAADRATKLEAAHRKKNAQYKEVK
jgi:uncharacterized protein YukE